MPKITSVTGATSSLHAPEVTLATQVKSIEALRTANCGMKNLDE